MTKHLGEPCPKCSGAMKLTDEREQTAAPPSPKDEGSDIVTTIQTWQCENCGMTVEHEVASARAAGEDVSDTRLRNDNFPPR